MLFCRFAQARYMYSLHPPLPLPPPPPATVVCSSGRWECLWFHVSGNVSRHKLFISTVILIQISFDCNNKPWFIRTELNFILHLRADRDHGGGGGGQWGGICWIMRSIKLE